MSGDKDPNIVYGGDFVESIDCASLGDLLIKHLSAGGDKPALINGVTGETWTFRDILVQSSKLARVLYGAGIRQNDVITIISENRFEFTAISFGAILVNAIIAPLNTTYTERKFNFSPLIFRGLSYEISDDKHLLRALDCEPTVVVEHYIFHLRIFLYLLQGELKHSLDISKPKFVFVSRASANAIPLLKTLSCVERIILLDNDNAVKDAKIVAYRNFLSAHESTVFDVEKYASQPVKRSDQVALIFMSSGTTGLPKGCQQTHENVIACITHNMERVALVEQLFEKMISLTVAPWFHAMGFMSILLSATSKEFILVYLPKFEPELYLGTIQKYGIVSVQAPPPIVVFLAKTHLFSKYNLSSLKVIICGAAPLTLETENQVKERFNNEIFVLQGYGQTEATLGVLYANVATGKPGSVGEVVRGTFGKVIDSEGRTLGPNKVGELCFKGPFVMKGYVGNESATAATIDKDGWLHSGDLGYYDEDLQFFIVDRLKELIKYKGFQVAPAELEGLLLSHQKIKDAGVIGIPDEAVGELPFAFVVKQDNAELTVQEVKDFVAKSASNAKWLRGGVRFVDEIPKNPSGKILRRELRDLYKSTKSKL